jgi:predicted O-methyltransferase YrrM
VDGTLAFCAELDEIYRTRRATGRSGRLFDNLAALSTTNNLLTLRALMMARRPARTLEVGMSFGGSALTIAASHRDLGRRPEGQHVAIDPYQTEQWDNCGVVLLERAGVSGFVTVREQPSALGLAALVGEGRRFDLIYVDGSHIFEDVFVDAYFGVDLLADEGLILFDDSADPHVAKVLRFLATNWTARVQPFKLDAYRPDGRSARYKMGSLLGKTQLRAFQRQAAGPRPWNAPFRQF